MYPLVSLLYKEIFAEDKLNCVKVIISKLFKMPAFADLQLNMEMVWSPGGSQVQRYKMWENDEIKDKLAASTPL